MRSAPTNEAICRSSEISIALLYGGIGSKLRHDPCLRDRQGAVERTTTGASVAATAELLGYCSHIQLSFAAQADTESSIGKLAEKHRYLNVLDRERVVYQPFAVFFLGSEALHLLTGDPDPRQRSFAVKVGKRRAQQSHLGSGMSEIHTAGTMRRIGAGQYQFPRQSKSMLVGAFKHERTSVREHSGVEAGCNLGRNFHAGFARQTIHHLRSRHCFRINPVDVRKRSAAHVMIDVDQKAVFQAFKPGA